MANNNLSKTEIAYIKQLRKENPYISVKKIYEYMKYRYGYEISMSTFRSYMIKAGLKTSRNKKPDKPALNIHSEHVDTDYKDHDINELLDAQDSIHVLNKILYKLYIQKYGKKNIVELLMNKEINIDADNLFCDEQKKDPVISKQENISRKPQNRKKSPQTAELSKATKSIVRYKVKETLKEKNIHLSRKSTQCFIDNAIDYYKYDHDTFSNMLKWVTEAFRYSRWIECETEFNYYDFQAFINVYRKAREHKYEEPNLTKILYTIKTKMKEYSYENICELSEHIMHGSDDPRTLESVLDFWINNRKETK